MKRILFSSIFIVILAVSGFSSSYNQAVSAYSEGSYEEAFILFEEHLSEENHPSADAFYNYANAAFKLQKLGPAVYGYTKCLSIQPNHEDAAYNLNFVESQLIDPPSFSGIDLSGPDKLLLGLSTPLFEVLLTLFALFGTAAFILFAAQFKLKWKKKTVFSIGIACWILVFSCYLILSIQENIQEDIQIGVIQQQSVYVTSEPGKGTELYILHEGSKVKVLNTNQKYIEISYSDRKGWVPKQTLQQL